MFVVMSVLFGAFNVIATSETNDEEVKILTEEDHVSFSQATITQKGEYVSVNVEETNTVLKVTGQPILPSYTKTFIYPRGTKIKNVECIISDVKSQLVDGKIELAPEPVKLISIKNSISEDENTKEFNETPDIYSSSDLYPEGWFDYKVYSGLIDDEPSIILKVNCYPIRYLPNENTIYVIDSCDIEVTYEEPINQKPVQKLYDMVIICPRRFVINLLPLVGHKNLMGIHTKIQTVESINKEYFNQGRDKPERIKLFIKFAEQNWGIHYVLLVGGLKSHIYANDRENKSYGDQAWYVPVRYTNIDEGFISDLYYADLYKGEGEFEDWDPNGNGVFAENWEELDLFPDVYYGRLPCRNKFEVNTVVRKIKNYERMSHWKEDWFKTMIVVGGITFQNLTGPGHDGQEPDGEWLCNVTLDYMKSQIKTPIRIFASNKQGPRPIAGDILSEYSKGAGFVLFQGHGNCFMWDTKYTNATGDLNWVGGLATYSYPGLRNGRKLPIVVVGGCHNGLFNITLLQTMFDSADGKADYHAYGALAKVCFSWKLLTKPRGGAIASTGCTNYGIGWPSDPLNLSAMLESNFFYKVGIDKVSTLGQAHSGSIIKYMMDVNVHGDSGHTYSITEYQLFGDPSLMIGGKVRPSII